MSGGSQNHEDGGFPEDGDPEDEVTIHVEADEPEDDEATIVVTDEDES